MATPKYTVHARIGMDNRLDISDLDPSDRGLQLAARIAPAVCFLVPRRHVHHGDGLLSVATVGPMLDDRFAMQPCIQSSRPLTGFFVTTRHVVTAGHGISGTVANDWIALLDFVQERLAAADSDGLRRYKFASHQHIGVKAIRLLHDGDPGDDLAILELAHPVRNRKPAGVLCSTPPSLGAPVAMVGHPFAQPIKATVPWPTEPRATPRVLHADSNVLETTLDAFIGNSGSPVIELAHGLVLAVHNAGFGDQPGTSGLVLPEGSLGARATRLTRFESILRDLGAVVR